MILGIILAILLSAIIGLIGFFVASEVYSETAERVARIVTYSLVAITLVSGAFMGCSMENAGVEKDYYGFLSVKQTYETAVSDTNISGLERLEITKVVMEQNSYIAKKKVDMTKWYSFVITDENKQLILSLKPIQ